MQVNGVAIVPNEQLTLELTVSKRRFASMTLLEVMLPDAIDEGII